MTLGRQLNAERLPEINLVIAVDCLMDGHLFRNALERPWQRFKITSCAVSKAELSRSLESHPLDVALVSESLHDGPMAGFEVLNEIRNLSPQTRTIMLLKSDNTDLVVDAFRAGAKGVFCRTESLSLLPKCIRAVHGGHIWANSKQLDRIMQAFASAVPFKITSSPGERRLTKREQEVVTLVVEGFSNHEVAAQLGITNHTVSNYLFRIYEKLGISTRVELVLYSLRDNR